MKKLKNKKESEWVKKIKKKIKSYKNLSEEEILALENIKKQINKMKTAF